MCGTFAIAHSLGSNASGVISIVTPIRDLDLAFHLCMPQRKLRNSGILGIVGTAGTQGAVAIEGQFIRR
jgi:hypothetical protein